MRRSPKEHGQAVVETSIAILVFALCVMGVTDLGRAAYTYNGLSNLAREGSHYAMLEFSSDSSSACYWDNLDTSGCLSAVKSYIIGLKMSPGLSESNLSVSMTVACGGSTACSPGLPITVSISTQFQPVATALLSLGPFPISATSTDEFVLPSGTATPTVTATPSATGTVTPTAQPTPTVVPEGPPSNVTVTAASGCTTNCQVFNVSWTPPANTVGLGHYDVTFGLSSTYAFGDSVPPKLNGTLVSSSTIDTGSQNNAICFDLYSVFADGLSWYATGSWHATGIPTPAC